ncbi:hypothetical protein [Frankia sp. CiP1_Cm_nod2]|uniref:hypothetical protein n=1 Tax=Frankia sp. CiP1_Cm_nod2 TaxID=2897161 RepID=UPI002024A3DA
MTVLRDPRFVDANPTWVCAILLDEGVHSSLQRSMYQPLAEAGESEEHRTQARHPVHVRPEFSAAWSNEIRSRDATKLHSPERWIYYCLYIIADVYNRCAIGWMLAGKENEALARTLPIVDRYATRDIGRGRLTVHADGSGSPPSKPVVLLFADPEVIRSDFWLSMSSDSPYLGLQFATTRYRFDCSDDVETPHARCRVFFVCRNGRRRRFGLELLTPAEAHYGQARAIRMACVAVLPGSGLPRGSSAAYRRRHNSPYQCL